MRNEQTTIDDVESLRAAMAAGLHPSFLFFWGHTAKDANVGKHVLSQWCPPHSSSMTNTTGLPSTT